MSPKFPESQISMLTLQNGLKLAYQPTPTSTINARFRVNFGGLHEKPGEEGIAHFLEHFLVTGGTEEYSPEEQDAIRESFGHFNATTNAIETVFQGDFVQDQLHEWLSFVKQTVFHPSFNAQRMEEERQRVLREMADRRSNPFYGIHREFLNRIMGHTAHQRNYETLGESSVISTVTPENLIKFHQRGYFAGNSDLVIEGGIPDDLEETITSLFSSEKAGESQKIVLPRNPAVEHFVMHIPPPYSHDQKSTVLEVHAQAPAKEELIAYSFGTAAAVLERKLFHNLSQRKGLCYGINIEYSSSRNFGLVSVKTNVVPERLEEALDAIFSEMQNLRRGDFTQEEVQTIKHSAVYHTAKSLETNGGHVHELLSYIKYGRTRNEHLKSIDGVTWSGVLDAMQIFPSSRQDKNYALYIVDPLKRE